FRRWKRIFNPFFNFAWTLILLLIKFPFLLISSKCSSFHHSFIFLYFFFSLVYQLNDRSSFLLRSREELRCRRKMSDKNDDSRFVILLLLLPIRVRGMTDLAVDPFHHILKGTCYKRT
ncbi:hypothetical protein LINPERHAP2_LOCUS35541, partial [Linum perenne]